MFKQLLCGCKTKDQTVVESYNDVLTCICENCNKITYLGTMKTDSNDVCMGISIRKKLPKKYLSLVAKYVTERTIGDIMPDIDELAELFAKEYKSKNFNSKCNCPKCTAIREQIEFEQEEARVGTELDNKEKEREEQEQKQNN